MNFNIVDLAHLLLFNLTNGDGNYIDGTAGNGYDSLFIANMLQKNGRLFSFDISEEAIQNSTLLLKKNNMNLSKISFIHDNHARIDKYLHDQSITAAIFNLGYLPGSDKIIQTNAIDTLTAINHILQRLQKKGIVIISSYIGHDGGEENAAVEKYLMNLSMKEFEISKTKMIRRKNAPILYLIMKRE
jgi:tRNA1(Val) A37 N6-methylase TrmN6